jgi:cytochrome b pre-mRNA-processing protein 3
MDKNLREMGVSDISIPKKMKPMLAAFYGRAKTYEQVLSSQGEALQEALRRNIYGSSLPSHEDILHLSDYVRRAHEGLFAQDILQVLAGQISFPAVMHE